MAKFQCNVISYSLKRTVDITVIVPTPTIPQSMGMGMKEGETPRHTPKALYPVLYLLHGGGNNQSQWTGYTKVELYAEEHQIIVVNMAGENKFFTTAKGGDDFYRFISEELPDFVTGLFPASKDPKDTYIAGLSMGAYGTMIHGLTHPEKYAAMGVLSCGGGQLKRSGAMGMNSEVPDEHVPNTLLTNWNGKAFPKVYVAVGKDDFGYAGCVETKDLFIKAGADVTYDELEGYGHEWRFWDIEIEKFLKWLPRTDAYAADGPRQI